MQLFKLPKVRVQDSQSQFDETLTCIDRSSWSHDVEMNQSDQLSFTAINDDSIGYQLLENENYILFADQFYRIKQADKDDSGYDHKREISATHIRFDAQYVYQYDKHAGSWTVAPEDLMRFVFDQNELGNQGFTWEIIGNPDKVQVDDYGEKSGQDCISDCCEKFSMVVTANNRHLILQTMDEFSQKTDITFKYLYNTPEFKTSIDTTDIQNIAKCYGKTKDQDGDGATNVGGTGKPSAATPTGSGTIGTVSTMEEKGAPVYADPGTEQATIVQYLANGTKWLVANQQKIGDDTWYQVSTNGWVSNKYLTFDKSGDVKPESHEVKQVTGQGTIKAASSANDQNVTTVNLYNSPWTPQSVIRQLNNGDQYKILSEVDDGAQGKTWYCLGTDEWVISDDMNFDGDTDVQPVEIDDSTDTDGSTADDKTEYYFDPFIVRDDESIQRWGERAGAPISDERFTDVEHMREYALSAMKSQPDVSMSLTYSGNDKLKLGDMVYAIIKPENFNTWVTVTAIKTNELSWYSSPEITLNSTPQNLVDYEVALQQSLQAIHGKVNRFSNVLSAIHKWDSNATITQKVGEVND